MNRPSFLEGVLVALAAAVAAASARAALGLVLPAAEALTLVLAALGLGYLLYLLTRSGEPVGRVLMVLAWLGLTGLSLALAPDPLSQAATQLGLVWVARVWCLRSTPLGAALDLGLILVGGCAALWAGSRTDSVFLAVWSLMLVQALMSAIPTRLGARPAPGPTASDPFELARRAAETALHRLDAR